MFRRDEIENWEHMIHTYNTNDVWKCIIEPNLRESSMFEIRCWNEEEREIQLALPYGKIQPTNSKTETVIKGHITPAFINFLLSFPQPKDKEIYNKMTPFFTIHLDNGFWSEHYGTELNYESVS